jgi:hypothetical protein
MRTRSSQLAQMLQCSSHLCCGRSSRAATVQMLLGVVRSSPRRGMLLVDSLMYPANLPPATSRPPAGASALALTSAGTDVQRQGCAVLGQLATLARRTPDLEDGSAEAAASTSDVTLVVEHLVADCMNSSLLEVDKKARCA